MRDATGAASNLVIREANAIRRSMESLLDNIEIGSIPSLGSGRGGINPADNERPNSQRQALQAVIDKATAALAVYTAFPITPQTITLNESLLTFANNGTAFEDLTETVLPATAVDKTVVWSSSDEDVAVVDSDGVVDPKALGTCTISCTTVEGGLIATCDVIVVATIIVPTSITLDEETLTFANGAAADQTLTETVLPVDAVDKTVAWASDDEAVATVADGVVTSIAAGTCTISCTTNTDELVATCEVTVSA